MTGNVPAGGYVPPPFDSSYPPMSKAGPAGVWLGAVAAVLAAAALVVGIVALNTAQQETAPQPPRLLTEAAKAQAVEVFVDVPDRELRRAMGPLMNEQLDGRPRGTNWKMQ